MENKKTKHPTFLWVLIIWSVSIALSILGYKYRIYLVPTNILGTTSLYGLIWLPGLFVLGKYIVNGLVEKKHPILFISLVIVLGACLFEVLAVFASSEDPSCYSISREGFTVKYQCVCKENHIESAYVYDYDDCQFSRFVLFPVAQKAPLTLKRWGELDLDRSNRADFIKEDWKGKPFDIEYPNRLIIEKFGNSGYVQLGYINFQFMKSTNTFNISFIADLECSKYYTDPVAVKNTEDVSIRLCGKEYNFKFINYHGNIIVELQE